MKKEKKVIELDDWEHRFLVGCLLEARNSMLEKDKPIEDICVLMKNVIEAPTKKERKKAKTANEAR